MIIIMKSELLTYMSLYMNFPFSSEAAIETCDIAQTLNRGGGQAKTGCLQQQTSRRRLCCDVRCEASVVSRSQVARRERRTTAGQSEWSARLEICVRTHQRILNKSVFFFCIAGKAASCFCCWGRAASGPGPTGVSQGCCLLPLKNGRKCLWLRSKSLFLGMAGYTFKDRNYGRKHSYKATELPCDSL